MRRAPRDTQALLVLLVGAALGGPSCKRLKHDKPYTPFGIASALPAPSASQVRADDAASAPVPAFALEQAVSAPGASERRWRLGGMDLEAPAERTFALGLVGDFDADGQSEALTWSLPAGDAGPTSAGELWLHTKNGRPRRVLELPAFVPSRPGCPVETELSRTGPHSVTLDCRASCGEELLPRSAARALVVLRPLDKEPVLLTLRVANPAPGETLELDATTTDRDGDGRDDVEVQVGVGKSGEGDVARAPLLWFDRKAGLARDPEQPGLALAQNASREVVRARGRATSRSVKANVDNQRRLLSTLCAEGGVARVLLGSGSGIACGPLPTTASRLLHAEVSAALTLEQPAEAVSALVRADWYFDDPRDKDRRELEERVRKAVTERAAAVRSLALRVEPARGPRYSPLRFEPDGTLIVKTTSGANSVSRDMTETTPIEPDSGRADWATEAIGPEGKRFIGLTLACNHSELLLEFAGPDGARLPAVPSGILAPRPGSCAGGRNQKLPDALPISWTKAGFAALIAGIRVGPRGPHANPGAPLSPDSTRFVTPTPLGLLVGGGERPEIWNIEGPDGLSLGELEGCVVANGAKAVACTLGARVLVITPKD